MDTVLAHAMIIGMGIIVGTAVCTALALLVCCGRFACGKRAKSGEPLGPTSAQ